MSCEFDCVYKNLASQTQSELSEIIDQNEEWVRQQEAAAANGWGDNGARDTQNDRQRDLRRISEMLEIDGLLCTEYICGFAVESVRKRVEEMSFDIKLRREQK